MEEKKEKMTIIDTFLYAVKNGQFRKWLYEFQHGHPFLLDEEATIIVSTRLSDKGALYLNDEQIQNLIKLRVKKMYKSKFPNAKRWSLPMFTL
jgi:hypothetical protein